MSIQTNYTEEEYEYIRRDLISGTVTLIITMIDKPTNKNIKLTFDVIKDIFVYLQQITPKNEESEVS